MLKNGKKTALWNRDDIPAEPAGSVIVVREKTDNAFELYMTRRSEKLSFLGGYHVFPGGKVDEEDYDAALVSRCRGLSPESAAEIFGGGIDPLLACGHWVAALRELFEEAGILLAYDDGGKLVDFTENGVNDKFNEYRENIHARKIGFVDMLTKENLTLATDRLEYICRWLVPAGTPRRYDARFFAAVLPALQEPRFHPAEVSEQFWLEPAEALRKHETGEWLMMPATVYVLMSIELNYSIEDLLSSRADPH